MDYVTILPKAAILTRTQSKIHLHKYGHLLKWKDHKEDILDIGCADGFVTRNVLYPYIKDHTEKLIAIDKLEKMINSAKLLNREEKIEFQVMDAVNPNHIENFAGKFDHIFSFYVAHWIPDNKSFLNGLYKMLKSKGQIFLVFPVNHPIHESFEKHLKEGTWSKYLSDEKFIANYTEDPEKYLRSLLKDVGFQVDFFENKYRIDRKKNFTDMIKSLVLMNKSINFIPKELQERYVTDHVRNCCEQSKYLEADTYEVIWEEIICIASKDA